MLGYYFPISRNEKIWFDPDGTELPSAAQTHGGGSADVGGDGLDAIALAGALEVAIVTANVFENSKVRTHLSCTTG